MKIVVLVLRIQGANGIVYPSRQQDLTTVIHFYFGADSI